MYLTKHNHKQVCQDFDYRLFSLLYAKGRKLGEKNLYWLYSPVGQDHILCRWYLIFQCLSRTCLCVETNKYPPRTKTPVIRIHRKNQRLTASSAITSDPKLIYTGRFYKCCRSIFTKKVHGIGIILVSHTKCMIPMTFRGIIKYFNFGFHISLLIFKLYLQPLTILQVVAKAIL